MKLGGLFLLASLLTLNTRLQAIGICVEECREDGDCAAGEKCINNGCGHVCSPAPRATLCCGLQLHKLAYILFSSIKCPIMHDICAVLCLVAQSCLILHNCSPLGSSVHGHSPGKHAGCFRDRDCGAGRQCVSEGCNRVCSPAPQASIVKTRALSGSLTRSICVQRCRGNWDCGAGERCIRKGCSRVCSPVRTGGVGICLDQCQGHQDRPAGSQCVSNGCGRVCSPTPDQREQRPGTCPGVPEGMVGTCAKSCIGDRSCPPGQKCCSNGCGKSCQVPDLGFTIRLDDK
ncbi:unnamed protein product [Rangifer tarandus platyrhynchus]|uniref:Uncharacterized protein n=1 Tax=Rangifer tarandus platyrhynchus TaxID=3082113 RepID=A0AC59YXD4_RANTA